MVKYSNNLIHVKKTGHTCFKKALFCASFNEVESLLMFVVKIFECVKEHNFAKFEDRKGIVNPNLTKKWIPSGIVFRRNLKKSSLYLQCLYCSVFLDNSHLLLNRQTNHLKEQCNRSFYKLVCLCKRNNQSAQFNFILVTTSKLFFISCSQSPA